jgi:succinylglutamate desuccinylase
MAATDLPRVIGEVGRPGAGPTLAAVGSLHGNEPCGHRALVRLVARLSEEPRGVKGWFVALTGNRAALAAGRRYLVDDLNRAWRPERLRRVRAAGAGLEAEDREILELDRELHRVMAAAKGPVSVLDLHSTSGGGHPFVTLDDTLANRRLAFAIPVPQVLGLEEVISGTMLSHLIAQGVAAVGFESGQSDDPRSVDRAEAAAWIALEATGVLARGRPEVAAARALLARETASLPRVFEVRHRHPIADGEVFVMEPGFASFQPVKAGAVLARKDGAVVRAPSDGRILMPLYQAQGAEGFFLIRRVRGAWLALSTALRRLGARRVVHWLPGVSRRAGHPGQFVVDRRVARIFALEVFHLLGYRRVRATGPLLLMAPRGSPGPA